MTNETAQHEAEAPTQQVAPNNELLAALPAPGKRVVIFWVNPQGKKRSSMGFYVPKHHMSAENWDDVDCADYCEEEDEYYCPEGWHEEMWEAEHFYPITGQVVGWQELPEFPGPRAPGNCRSSRDPEPQHARELLPPRVAGVLATLSPRDLPEFSRL